MNDERDSRPASRVTLLAAAYAVSSYGTYLNMLALGLFAFELSDSALHTGLFMALRLGTGFVAGPVAGWAASRYHRKRLMIGADLVSATAVLLLAAAPSVATLYTLAIVLGAAQAQWGVAMRSSVPALAGGEQLSRLNGRLVSARSVAMLLGFASAGVLVSWLGFSAVFLIDAASFLTCAALLLAVPIPAGGGPAKTKPAAGAAGRALLGGVAPLLLGMIAVRSLDAFGSASHNVALPVYGNLVWPDDPAGFVATFTTAWAVGSLVAGRWLARWASETAFGFATCLMSVCFVLGFTGLPMWLLIPVAFTAGLSDGFAEISYTTRLQAVGEPQRAKLFGYALAAQNAGFGAGMVGAAMLLDRYPPLPVVAGAHAVALLAAVAFLAVYLRRKSHEARDQLRRGPAAGPGPSADAGTGAVTGGRAPS